MRLFGCTNKMCCALLGEMGSATGGGTWRGAALRTTCGVLGLARVGDEGVELVGDSFERLMEALDIA
jgi:hypothetical protein